ncbi:isochorismatase family protein [Tatumella sp. UCD-D_suzukii]|uniref:isochorismatase family protein n=1 Tax=Tatumella sp. UCD-D_suzukii TaxID=1408192 RepID=UPI00047242EB|nr:isochorismatase family protein [Tatumella sp. UCD-D_suzukii]
MMKSALLVIDVQDSFLHRDDWSDADFPAFSASICRLISGCEALEIPVVDIFHVSEGLFAPDSGYVKRMSFLRHTAAKTAHKHVHNALADSSLSDWLIEEAIGRLIICGMRTEQCCETTARVARDSGFEVQFVSEATLTFAMQWQSREYTADEIRQHTSMVLNGRFADVCTVDECLQRQGLC